MFMFLDHLIMWLYIVVTHWRNLSAGNLEFHHNILHLDLFCCICAEKECNLSIPIINVIINNTHEMTSYFIVNLIDNRWIILLLLVIWTKVLHSPLDAQLCHYITMLCHFVIDSNKSLFSYKIEIKCYSPTTN